MLRIIIPMVLVLILSLIHVGNPAMAFTVRFGPAHVSENLDAIHETTDTALPTPRMLNVAVGANGLTFGPLSATPDVTVPVPTVRIPSRVQAPVTDVQSTSLAHRIVAPRQLSGVEIMLLRGTKQIAER